MENYKQLLSGKKGIIMGVANQYSIAYGIAKELKKHGAELCLTYHPNLESRILKASSELETEFVIPCDAEKDEDIINVFKVVGNRWDNVDFLIHSIAFANKEDMSGKYSQVTQEGFQKALNVSCYSFTAAARECAPLMKNGGSMVTLSYYGAKKFIPHYNVMGVAKAALEGSVMYLANDFGVDNIKVNCISAGPIKTLAASAIKDFNELLDWHATHSPIKQNTTLEQVGKTSVYLVSDLSDGVTGSIIYVDSGYHTIGVRRPNN
ncbi:MAG: enoyl-ACP reductase [Alphaproteobacteria bacterium]|nr:MAG: enoyl-ACP reductase [Alphaproteobacteria bacterium]